MCLDNGVHLTLSQQQLLMGLLKHVAGADVDLELYAMVETNEEVTIDGQAILVDFLVSTWRKDASPVPVSKLAVYCHSPNRLGHGRIAEDRRLQAAGIHVMRFTEDESQDDPMSCALLVKRYLRAILGHQR